MAQSNFPSGFPKQPEVVNLNEINLDGILDDSDFNLPFPETPARLEAATDVRAKIAELVLGIFQIPANSTPSDIKGVEIDLSELELNISR